MGAHDIAMQVKDLGPCGMFSFASGGDNRRRELDHWIEIWTFTAGDDFPKTIISF